MLTQTAAAYERLGKRREAAALVRQAADMARPDGLVLPLPPATGTCGAAAGVWDSGPGGGGAEPGAGERQPGGPAAGAAAGGLCPLTEREWAVAQRDGPAAQQPGDRGAAVFDRGHLKQYINQIYSKLHLTGDARTKRRRLRS